MNRGRKIITPCAWNVFEMTAPEISEPSPQLPIAVGVVEDDPEVRALFERAVRQHPRLALMYGAATARQAIEMAKLRRIDVLLVDLGLPDRDGREVIRWFSTHQPDVLAMVVTMFGDEEHVVSSFEAGAVGYLLKDTPSEQLGQWVVELFEGGSPISPTVARSVIKRFSPNARGATTTVDNPLSQRELEVLRLIEKGLTYEEVATTLGLTWHTVTGYLRRVYGKLEVNSKSQAVFEARQRGIL